MDAIAAELLTALAGGAGGQLGERAWAALSSLVRRPFRSRVSPADRPDLAAGQITALENAPGDLTQAHALSASLVARSNDDPEFAAALTAWLSEATMAIADNSSVNNSVSGGSQANVVQGRDFGSISFTTAAPPPPGRAGQAGGSSQG